MWFFVVAHEDVSRWSEIICAPYQAHCLFIARSEFKQTTWHCSENKWELEISTNFLESLRVLRAAKSPSPLENEQQLWGYVHSPRFFPKFQQSILFDFFDFVLGVARQCRTIFSKDEEWL